MVWNPTCGKSKDSIIARTARRSPKRRAGTDGKMWGVSFLAAGPTNRKLKNGFAMRPECPASSVLRSAELLFFDPLVALRDAKISREEAVEKIARRYMEWVSTFERGAANLKGK